MAQRLLNPFDQRQVMRRDDFEIFHYNNPACCSCPPHQHDFFELFFLLDDHIDNIVEGMRYSLSPGSAMLVAPGQLHRPDVPGPTRSVDRFVLWINTQYVRSITDALPRLHYALWGDMTGRNLIQLDGENAAEMRQLLFALHREDARPGADSAALSRSILAQLLIYCARSIASRTSPPTRPSCATGRSCGCTSTSSPICRTGTSRSAPWPSDSSWTRTHSPASSSARWA